MAALAAVDKAAEAVLGTRVKVLDSAERRAVPVGGSKAVKPADKGAAPALVVSVAADKVAEADKVVSVVAVSPPTNNASKCANECSNSWEAGTSNP